MSDASRITGPKPGFDPQTFLARAGGGVLLERFQKNQEVFVQGDAANMIGYLRKGTVKAAILTGRGKEAIVGIFEQGQFFGEAALGNSEMRTATFVTLEDSLISLITREAISAELASEPAFAKFFVTQLLSRNARLEEDLIDQLLNSSEKRLARLLLLLANASHEHGKPITLALNQEALADMIGTTRSRVSTFMNRFREKGYISYDSHTGQIEVYSAPLLSMLGS